jgi:rhamnogalacturonyl hydrolase YesR
MIKVGFILSFCFFTFFIGAAKAQPLPSKRVVLEYMSLANNYFIKKWPDPTTPIIVKKEWPSNIWTRAVYFEGLMAFYKIKPDTACYNYAVHWGEWHKWGIRGGVETRNADNHCCGQTYIDLYMIDKKTERINDIKASVDLMISSPTVDDWNWIDALQMAMPVYAKLGTLLHDKSYYDKMYQMYIYTKTQLGGSGLYNPKDKLWWRDKDFVAPYTEPNGEDCYWSRGNGWVVAALVRVLEATPKNLPHRDEYRQTLIKMLNALKEVQRPDGFWNVSLHDPSYLGGPEFTGTALFTYGMAWAVNNNVVSKKKFLPVIEKAWNAISKESVHPNGFLGYVQGTGKQPSDGQPVDFGRHPDFEDFGLGCFLLAGSEVYKLSK